MAKAVLLKDDEGFMLAMVPSDKSVDLNTLNLRTNRLLMTASQKEVKEQFEDCAKGAVPGIGQAYNLRVIWDDSIVQQPDCYLEAGDHEELIYLARKDFQTLMQDRDHGRICH
jgi:Ala-tRNA(Pro) deacylase